MRSYALFGYENVKLKVLGVFEAAIHPFVVGIADAASCAKFGNKSSNRIKEVRIKIQIHVSIKFTPGINPYVLSDLFFGAKPISTAQFFFLQPIRMEHFAIFLFYDWAGKIWPLGGKFGRLDGPF